MPVEKAIPHEAIMNEGLTLVPKIDSPTLGQPSVRPARNRSAVLRRRQLTHIPMPISAVTYTPITRKSQPVSFS